MRIGIISDTHNMLREEVVIKLKGCDYILHAGDFCKCEILEQLEVLAPVYGVRGNNDQEAWAERLPVQRVVEIEGYRIGMAHEKKDLPYNCGDVSMMVYGHSHKYEAHIEDGIWYINPGSCGRKRFGLPLSFVIVEIDKEKVDLEKIDL